MKRTPAVSFPEGDEQEIFPVDVTKSAGTTSVPNRHFNVVEEVNPVPEISTSVPPLVGPPDGEMLVIMKNKIARKLEVNCLLSLRETSITADPAADAPPRESSVINIPPTTASY